MQLHIETLFTHDPSGDMVAVNDPSGAPAPRFFMGVTRDGPVWRFRGDVEGVMRAALISLSDRYRLRLGALDVVEHLAEYHALLNHASPVQHAWAGRAFHCPPRNDDPVDAVLVGRENADVLSRHLAAWIPDVRTAQPMMAVLLHGHAVAVCCSVRKSESAHEAGVETAALYRRRGYGARAVTAWAAAVSDSGAVPLYSTAWRNAASRALARHLDLRSFGTDLHIT